MNDKILQIAKQIESQTTVEEMFNNLTEINNILYFMKKFDLTFYELHVAFEEAINLVNH